MENQNQNLTVVKKACKSCGNERHRQGWYCEPCREKAEIERKRKSGSKPHYVKVNCSDCGGTRDRQGYLCNTCHKERQNIRKNIIKQYRDESRLKAIQEIKARQEQKHNKEI